ncbi:MAG TPA: hypothetical protein DDW78_06500 [Treponema sp.]|nr:hypothetical protein [Treponema sp.]
MRGSGKTPGLPFAKRSVQQAVRVFFRRERIFVFILNPWGGAFGGFRISCRLCYTWLDAVFGGAAARGAQMLSAGRGFFA